MAEQTPRPHRLRELKKKNKGTKKKVNMGEKKKENPKTKRKLTKNDNRGGTIANLLVLRTGQLDHALGGRVSDINLTQNRIPVVGEDNATHRVQQHLQHRTRTQARPDNVGHSLRWEAAGQRVSGESPRKGVEGNAAQDRETGKTR
jgi:hypothetical protein